MIPPNTPTPERIAPDAARARRLRLIGIGLMCGAVACFACLDATAKYLGRHVDMMEVVWARYASAFVLAFIVSNPITRPGLISTKRPLLQIGRSALLLGATVFNFAAFKYLRLDQALVIMFSIPLMVAALAGPTLGEWVGPRRWAAIGVGFLGVLVVVRPGYGAIHPAAILCVLSAVCAAFYAILTRTLARFDSNETTLFYSNLVGAVVMLPLMPMIWITPAEPLQIFLMITFGAFGSLGHFLLIAAHRHTPASVLSPFMYSQLVWTSTLGYLVFADVPNHATLAGAAVVVASGLYLVHRERLVGRR
jgi:drug/metabolite transporter (DMT)-like permease